MRVSNARIFVAGCLEKADALADAGYLVTHSDTVLGVLQTLPLDAPPDGALVALELPDGCASELLEHPLWRACRVPTAVFASDLTASTAIKLMDLCDIVVPELSGSRDLLDLAEKLVARRAAPTLHRHVEEFSAHYKLSPREFELLSCAVRGANNDEAAHELDCARPTIATYWNRIFAKTGCGSQRDVVVELLRFGYQPRTTPRTRESGIHLIARPRTQKVQGGAF